MPGVGWGRRKGTTVLVAAMLAAGATGIARAQEPGATVRRLSLEEALERAGRASEAVGIAEAQVQRAIGQQRQARSGYFPQLSGSATYTRTLKSQFSVLQSDEPDTTSAPSTCRAFQPDPNLPIGERVDSLESALRCLSTANPFAAFQDLPFGREHQYNFGLSLSQTIFDPRLAGQTHAAQAQRRSAEIGLESERAQLVVDVTSAYYDALLGDRLVAIAESTLAQAERTLREVELGRQVGTQPEFEVLRARVARDNQRPVLIQRTTARDLAYLRLKQLLDLPFTDSLVLTSTLDDTTAAPLPAYARDLATGDTLPDARAPVRQAEQAVEAAEGRRRAAAGQGLPAIRLSSAYAKIGFPESTLDFGVPFVTDWTVSLRVDVPLFTGGRIGGEKQAAQADVRQARLALEQTRELAALETRNTLATLQAAQAIWEGSVGTVEQAQRAYEIAEVRYREGISTQTELADARLLLQQAQANRALAARDLAVARVRVRLLPNLPFAGLTGLVPSTGAGASATPAAGGGGSAQATP